MDEARIRGMKHFGKRLLTWLAAVLLVLGLVVAICHFAQFYLGWSPGHIVEFGVKLSIGAVGLVSWLLPSPLHHRHLRIPRVDSRQLAVLIADSLRSEGLVADETGRPARVIQGAIDDLR